MMHFPLESLVSHRVPVSLLLFYVGCFLSTLSGVLFFTFSYIFAALYPYFFLNSVTYIPGVSVLFDDWLPWSFAVWDPSWFVGGPHFCVWLPSCLFIYSFYRFVFLVLLLCATTGMVHVSFLLLHPVKPINVLCFVLSFLFFQYSCSFMTFFDCLSIFSFLPWSPWNNFTSSYISLH